MKMAMLRLVKVLPKNKVHILLTLHDAVLLEVPESVPPKEIIPVVHRGWARKSTACP